MRGRNREICVKHYKIKTVTPPNQIVIAFNAFMGRDAYLGTLTHPHLFSFVVLIVRAVSFFLH